MTFKNTFLLLLLLISFGCTQKTQEKKEPVAQAGYQGFQYIAPELNGGVLKGVILLGGAGFDSFIISIDSSRNWTLEKAAFGESKVVEGQASHDEIKTGLETYIKSFLDAGVSGEHIHFVVSSTAIKDEEVLQIMPILEETGYQINRISEEEEGRYSYLATMPKGWENEGYVVDMGSGNTKISWMSEGKINTATTYGSKYNLLELTEEEILADVATKIQNVPTALRQKCFLIGGAPYKIAKAFNEYTDRYTVLKDLEEYEFADDQKAQNGVMILRTIQAQTQTSEFIFDWNSNFSIGFLIFREGRE